MSDEEIPVADFYDPAQLPQGRSVSLFVYTDAKPVTPGWYWWRESEDAPDEMIVEVVPDGEPDGDLLVYGDGVHCGTLLSLIEGQFAGPIPRPER